MTEPILQHFKTSIKDCEKLNSSLEIIKKNSEGKIWINGGFVYRNIANQLYDTKNLEMDLDFVVEKRKTIIELPEKWEARINRLGNPKFVNASKNIFIDFIPLETLHSITRRGLKYTIENYLTGTPLTIQSIAYDMEKEQIIGDIGITAILQKTVGINDLEEAVYASERKGLTLEEYVKEKAESLGFKSVLE